MSIFRLFRSPSAITAIPPFVSAWRAGDKESVLPLFVTGFEHKSRTWGDKPREFEILLAHRDPLQHKIECIATKTQVKPLASIPNPPLVKSLHVPASLSKSLGYHPDHVRARFISFLSPLIRPLEFLEYLAPLEKALEEKISKQGLPLNLHIQPRFLIEGKGYWILGPSSCQDENRSQLASLLSDCLLNQEQKLGINLQGAPIFMGPVDKESADAAIAQGNLFEEDPRIGSALLHGQHTHRLQWLGLFNFCHWYNQIKPADMLKLFVNTSVNEVPAWEFFFDQAPSFNAHSIDTCRSAYVFHSLLLCFGEHLGLPYLTRALRASFWQTTDLMTQRVMAESQPGRLSAEDAYLKVIGALEGDGKVPTTTTLRALLDPSYEQFPNASDIRIQRKGQTPLDPKNIQKVLEILKEATSDPELTRDLENDPQTLDQVASFHFYLTPSLKEIVLRSAILNNRLKLVQSLIEENVHIVPKRGYRHPLFLAIERNHTEVVQWLIAKRPALIRLSEYGKTVKELLTK